MSLSRPLRLALRLAALLIAALLFADSLGSGVVHVPEARLTNEGCHIALNASLPYRTTDYRAVSACKKASATRHQFDFTLPSDWRDRFTTLRIETSGCFLNVTMNGKLLANEPPLTVSSNSYCWRTIALTPSLDRDTQTLRVVVDNLRTKRLDVSVVRSDLLTANQTAIGLLLAAYLFSLSLASPSTLRRFHAQWLIILIFIASFAFPAKSPVLSVWWQHYLSLPCAVFFAVLLLAANRFARPILNHASRALGYVRRLPPQVYISACALLFFATAAAFSQILFGGLPHVADTHAQYVHSKIMSTGAWYAQAHPLQPFFSMQFMYVQDGRLFSNYPPGHPMLLAIGHWLRAPWLINPALGALCVPAIYLLAREIGGRSAGYVAAALTLASPFILFMASEYMNHVPCLLFLTLFLYAYLRLVKTSRWRYAALAGFCIGYAFITRPQAAIPFAAPVALHALVWLWQDARARWKPAALMAGVFSLFLAFSAYYSAVTAGHAGYSILVRPGHYVGLYLERSFSEDWMRMIGQVQTLHRTLFGWPGASSLLFVFLLFFLRLTSRFCVLLIACCLTVAASLLFNPFLDRIFAPRYLFEISGCLIALTALCLTRLPRLLAKRLPSLPATTHRGGMALSIAAMTALAFYGHHNQLFQTYRTNYWEGNAPYYHALMNSIPKPALVFIPHGKVFRLLSFTMPPGDSDPVIFANDREAENRKLINHYPGRHVYRLDGESLTPIR